MKLIDALKTGRLIREAGSHHWLNAERLNFSKHEITYTDYEVEPEVYQFACGWVKNSITGIAVPALSSAGFDSSMLLGKRTKLTIEVLD